MPRYKTASGDNLVQCVSPYGGGRFISSIVKREKSSAPLFFVFLRVTCHLSIGFCYSTKKIQFANRVWFKIENFS